MENNSLLFQVHKQRQDWQKKLDFYQDELLILRKELFITSEAHPDLPSVIEHVQEYRQIIKKKLDHIDEFKFKLLMNEKQTDTSDDQKMKDQIKEFEEEFNSFEQKIIELKGHLRRFISRNMK